MRAQGGELFSAGKGLTYGTFLGGSEDEYVGGMAIGSDGSTYLTGWTYSPDFPTTPGAFDRTLGGARDAFVSKLDPTGSTLVYSTYLGGSSGVSGWDAGTSIAVGPDGSAYVGGNTSSSNFPTTPGAFDRTYGEGDGFLAKLDPQGAALTYSTFLGGDSGFDNVFALALAGDGSVYTTGDTLAEDFPTTPGAFDATCGGNAFVTALNSAGSDLVASTCLGGDGSVGYGIMLGPDGSPYVTGETYPRFPTTPGAFDRTFNGGNNDGFVTRLNGDGTGLVYSTYLGGRGGDKGEAIALDEAGNAFVVGSTNSVNYPTTPGAYDRTLNSEILDDAVVTKLDPDGMALDYSTFLGGEDFDDAHDLVLNPDGSLSLTGETQSPNFPMTPGAFQPAMAGSGDAFVSRFDPAGSSLAYNSYLGGTDLVIDRGNAIGPAGPGVVLVAAMTQSVDFPVTTGAYDTLFNGAFDAGVVRLQVARAMHVDGITPGYRANGQGYVVGARIRIVYANGSPVDGARVEVEVGLPDGSTVQVSKQTGSHGIVLVARSTMNSGTYTFTVLDVIGPPAVYDPSQNIETSDSITIPLPKTGGLVVRPSGSRDPGRSQLSPHL